MLFKKHVKSRRKVKILLLFIVILLIAITLVALVGAKDKQQSIVNVFSDTSRTRSNGVVGGSFIRDINGIRMLEPEQPLAVLKSPKENGIIVAEKYDEHKIKARILQDKIAQLKKSRQRGNVGGNAGNDDGDSDPERVKLDTILKNVHIFYTAPVQWWRRTLAAPSDSVREMNSDGDNYTGNNAISPTTHKPMRILNTAFYPALGLYKPTKNLLQQHFESIRNCGVGVLILSFTGKPNEMEVYKQIFDLAPRYNLSVTFELSLTCNQSFEFVHQQLLDIKHHFAHLAGFYRVYSQSRDELVHLIYISNAYKLVETKNVRMFCQQNLENNVRQTLDSIYIGHIRLKNHAESMRRMCFDGFYSKLPSNGATFASTWKNWSYLKTFALTYNMLFVPTVGPGFAERNKFPRHGDIQRHRSNGRYYGVAWRTAILNHLGFITIASFNNWIEGSQIEPAIPKAGYLDYNPGLTTKYLDLTTHWVANFLKTRQETIPAANSGNSQRSCYELLNNTIC